MPSGGGNRRCVLRTDLLILAGIHQDRLQFMSTDPAPITAEEFLHLPDTDRPKELVKGRVVFLNSPYPRHGHYCAQFAFRLQDFVKRQRTGWVLINNVGVLTEREPDTVRSPDIVYCSYDRIPPGRLPDGYPQFAPEVVIEVRSKEDRYQQLLNKVAEYLFAGVTIVCDADPDAQAVRIFSSDQPVRVLTVADDWTLPEVLPGFSIPLASLFTV